MTTTHCCCVFAHQRHCHVCGRHSPGLDEPLREQLGGTARIVALEPGRKMAVDFGDGGVSTWELEDSQGKTRLTFVQSGFSTPRPPYAAWLGTLTGLLSLWRFVEEPDAKYIYGAVSEVV